MTKRRLVAALAATATLAASPGCRTSPRVHTFDVPGRPSAVAVLGDVVWVADDQRHVVHALDASSDDVIGEPIEVERNPVALAASRDAVWVAHASGPVVRIDADSRRADPPLDAGVSITGIAARGRRVWAADLGADTLIEINATSSRARRVYMIREGVVRVVTAGDALWVSNREQTITHVDPGSEEIGPTVDVGLGPIGLAFDGERIWVANSDDGTVSRLNASSGRSAGEPVRVGRGPVALAFAEGSLWVANQDDKTLTRVDADDGRVVGDPLDLGFAPRGIATGEDAIWVVGTNPSRIARVDL